MTATRRPLTGWCQDLWNGWDRFWFTPVDPHTVGVLRILCGLMLLYTHLVWSLDLLAFLGPKSWVPTTLVREMFRDSYAWSYLWYVESPAALWALHLLALAVLFAFTIGWQTRITSVLAVVITLSYCHRLPGALFGLDQVNAMLALYLALTPCGAVYSLDRWLAVRRGVRLEDSPSVLANVGIRLIQLHMCVIYLFGGIGKMRGELWWDGSAVWFALANYEYQSLDLTSLVRYPFLIACLTHVTVFWETFYAFLVWPRSTRPVTLGIAIMVHLGIVVFLGMPTFGFAMLIGNLAFVSPRAVRAGMGAWGSLVNRVRPRAPSGTLVRSLS